MFPFFLLIVLVSCKSVLFCEVQQRELLWFSLFNKNVLVSRLLKCTVMLSFVLIHSLHDYGNITNIDSNPRGADELAMNKTDFIYNIMRR